MSRIVITIVAAVVLLASCTADKAEQTRPAVYVSIAPQQYFAQRVAGDLADVRLMLPSGSNPVTYEPTIKQQIELKTAAVYFRIGVPFEDSFLQKITDSAPDLKVIDTREGIPLRDTESFEDIALHLGEKDDHHHEHEHEYEHEHGGKDPHIWMSPELVKIQAATMAEALIELLPQDKETIEGNLKAFQDDLDKLSGDIAKTLEPLRNRTMLVFHPAWGYFGDEFDLRQIPIEIEGKEPLGKFTVEIVRYAVENDIRVIFVQKQFDESVARSIAQEIEGSVIAIDPLSPEYLDNMRRIATTIAESL